MVCVFHKLSIVVSQMAKNCSKVYAQALFSLFKIRLYPFFLWIRENEFVLFMRFIFTYSLMLLQMDGRLLLARYIIVQPENSIALSTLRTLVQRRVLTKGPQ